MELRIRSIGNSLGIIFPKNITEQMNFHAEDIVKLDVDEDKEKLIVKRSESSLRDNLLLGIEAGQEDNVAFADSFDELEGEI